MNAVPHPHAPAHEVWQRPFVRTHRSWCDDFVVELRLRAVPGPVIGDRLGEVETHCAATGDTPAEAFGDPAAYAARIAEEGGTAPVSGTWTVTILSAAQVVALLVGTAAVTAWARGETLAYNVAQVGFLGLFVLVLLCLPRLVRPLVRRPWAAGVPLAGGIPLLALAAALSDRWDLPVALVLPSAPVAVCLFVAVLGLAWWEFRELARGLGDDLVTSPLSPEAESPAGEGTRRRWTALLPAGMIPVAYPVLAAFGWMLA
ncbi:hypothetical protein GMA12_06745 [Kocuria sediminis]|uniref:Uncharacterized protein n=1 Tax=Kocuria sediminis TaxID=1038857 RepID=A0A6N8GJD1_9MICC|nr:hypothetical protein [Kocuria sediminis]MUN62839.1 hypothetical protein [Kocuria sediminis]